MNSMKFASRNVVDKFRVRVPPKLSCSSPLRSHRGELDCKVHDCCHGKLLVQNYSNFKRSGQPVRFMYYEDGSWMNFSEEGFNLLKSGFLEGTPMVEVEIEGTTCLFDFYRMLQIDFSSGDQRSIAWVDVANKCFFPKTFVGGGGKFGNFNVDSKMESVDENLQNEIGNGTANFISKNPKIEVETIIGENSNSSPDSNSGKRKMGSGKSEAERGKDEKAEGSSSNYQYNGSKKKRLFISDLESPRWPKSKLLKEGEKAYSIVKNLFLAGLGIAEPGATITAIHQFMRTSPLDKARYEVFQKQMEIMKNARGDPKMSFAWHGTSAKGVESILTHGFGMPRNVPGSQNHGVGIYLSPIRSPHASAMLSEVDDHGEKHVILCRVILGKCEKVEAGSKQLYPSSVDFDTGVDDLNNPKWYVVWCANMNTHVLPECVVSYKSSYRVTGQSGGSSFLNWVPHAPNGLVGKLFSKLGSSLPPSKSWEVRALCSTYTDGKMGKDIFMKQLRSVVGDEVLRSTIREIRG